MRERKENGLPLEPQRPNKARSTVHDLNYEAENIVVNDGPLTVSSRSGTAACLPLLASLFALPDPSTFLQNRAQARFRRRGTNRRAGMAARYLRSGLPLLRTHLALSESAAIAQVPAPPPPPPPCG
jgi:hypothetical protein